MGGTAGSVLRTMTRGRWTASASSHVGPTRSGWSTVMPCSPDGESGVVNGGQLLGGQELRRPTQQRNQRRQRGARIADRQAEIYRSLRQLRDDNLALIRTRYPKIPRRVSGHNLDSLLPENHFDVARTLVGSEGTLIAVLQAGLTLVEVPKAKSMVVLGYPDIAAAGDAVMEVVAHDSWQLEGLDRVLIQLEKEAALAGDAIEQMPKGGGWMMVQFVDDDQEGADAKAQRLLTDLEHSDHPPTFKFLDDSAKEDHLVEVREAGLGATAHPVEKHDNWPGWEDSAVPPERLGFSGDLRVLLVVGRSDPHPQPVIGEHLHPREVVHRLPVGLRGRAAGVLTDHAAERAGAVGCRFWPVHQTVFGHLPVQLVECHTRLHDAGVLGLDVERHEVVAVLGPVDDHWGVGCLTAEAGPTAAGDDRRP